MSKTVSIVICTYNRAPFLQRTLHSLRKLHYRNFEVVVVNGPSTDHTGQVLEMYRDTIKIGENSRQNLSVSRNIGIALSSGEIIAFIDDDAIPDKMWLDDIVSMYEDPAVGGAGGMVFGPGDDHFQFENGYVDIWGDADVHCLDADFNDPDGDRYNMMLGTNCTFLRKALLETGGFDEYYDYFQDEADMCLRVVRAGYKIRNHKRAYIHHEYAKSHIRRDTFDGCHLNWYPITKNKAYFAVKNSEGKASESERTAKLEQLKQFFLKNYKVWSQEKKITREECRAYTETCKEAFARGTEDGYHLERQLKYDLDLKTPFQRYQANPQTGALSICLICRDDMNSAIGGTAKYTIELARGFARQGHLVHILTGGENDMDWMQEGISFHSIKPQRLLSCPELEAYPTTCENLSYSYQVYQRLEKIHERYGVDIAESVLWNYEGAVAARAMKGRLPLLVRLQTPLLKVCETQHWEITDDLRLFSDFERQMLLDAAGIIAISDHIRETIHELYQVDFNRLQTDRVYLGVDENTCISTRQQGDKTIRVLFVGRLERRKGIHTIFEAMPRLMQEHPELEFRFIGNADIRDETLGCTYLEHFRRTCGRESWAQRVKFLGQADNTVKDQEFRDCDIFVAPSLYESFGIILIEAMSAGKPAIGCRIGGMQEIIEDGKTGFAIEVENAEEFYQRMKTLIEDTALRRQMGENALQRFQKHFSNEVMIRNTLQVYRQYIRPKEQEAEIHE
ncbi:MAG: glycosyltransferase [Provencibacterium sp.]|jgi:glycosyltransferase involved in cell wall biosynthesis|nr:glycosyltransferase [Provencibacterium sp.]